MIGLQKWAAVVLAVVVGVGCANGDEGVMPRDLDGSVGRDAGAIGGRDAGPDFSACNPPCAPEADCIAGVCVIPAVDNDFDGIPEEFDCDDTDPTVGALYERACSSICGTGVERCLDAVWEMCTAPEVCDCMAETPPRSLDCGMCGTQSQVCVDGMWENEGVCEGQGVCSPGTLEMGSTCGNCGREERRCEADCTWGAWACVDEGECAAGETEMETPTCTPACGGTEGRSRSCSPTCTWGEFSEYAGCMACGPTCGDAMCETGETCESCADCQNGHMGVGDTGDSCAGVPAETWRCVTDRSGGFLVSQVCRSGSWLNFNASPRDCMACVCGFSLACCQAGSTSSACL